uniref:Saposin B-type domain-containing protein n=1 Tax=Panagrellus redivivus TaxID=6233 RepID=A0A7E4W6A6_PANRE
MNTVTVLVFAGLVSVVLSMTHFDCKTCHKVITDIRAEVGNDGKNATIPALSTALIHVCEKYLHLGNKCVELRSTFDIIAKMYQIAFNDGVTDEQFCFPSCHKN